MYGNNMLILKNIYLIIIKNLSLVSIDLIKFLKYAKSKKIKTVSFLGKNGGLAKKYSDINLVIPSNNTARIQEIHKFIGHFILEHTENKLIKKVIN